MRTDISKRIELLANVAIIAVAVLLVVVVVKKFLLADAVSPPTRAEVKVGNKIALPGVDWSKSDQHVVLVLQKGCHFCAESAPFYQRLIRETAGRNDLQLIATLPQSVEESRQYLGEMGLSISEVKQAAPSSVGAPGTPTLLLVDASGAVTGAWVGKLPPDKEAEVLRQLKLN
jgi:thioredoxin-related protein